MKINLKVFLVFILVPLVASCGAELNKYDETLSLSEQEWKSVYYDYDGGVEKLKITLTHISGTPISVCVMTKEQYTDWELNSRAACQNELSGGSITNVFQSDWVRLDYSGLLYIVMRPDDVQDGNWTTVRYNLKVDSKLSPA